jgi:hypothetical protein
LGLEPGQPAGGDVRPLLFGGMRGFFEADAAPVEEIPRRRRAGREVMLRGQRLGDLDQADVGPISHQPQNERLMDIQLRSNRQTLLARLNLPGLAVTPHPRPRRRPAYPKPLSRLVRRHAARNRFDHPNPKIRTVAPRHQSLTFDRGEANH